MGRTVSDGAVTVPLLKREDCKRTKHDSAFSQWKILIGPRDWEDYLLSKEGAERYRTHNLPNCSSCPGLYELGIAVSLPQTESKNSTKLSSKRIIPVYLGQADNVRTRLQQYGRDGAHLENGLSNGEQIDRKVLGLFSDIFSYGFAIAFRWAPMNNKKEAEKTESQLLKTFDYAWNRGMNGDRRPVDIHQKLTAASTKKLPLVFKKLHVLRPKKLGLNIKRCDPPELENGSSFYTKQKDTNILSRIFKFSRSRPTLVTNECEINNSDDRICGVALGHGSICTRPPVVGRKRCVDHKGMKVNASVKLKPHLVTNEDTCHVTCGVTLDDGCICTRVAVAGRKRCEEHKGMKIGKPVSRSGSDSETGTYNEGHNGKIGADSLTCVAVTRGGSVCRRKPSQNSKFCWQHDEMRDKING
ncbi:hypothetical protein L2E82_02900 [Cichorium intybus]|uniref:Uncharacterized protein n=1 Tax=Cichorium intybus TaxID=13427 RepID=A0ACB9H2X7_CICIN|nr:hypothetical protein L2E82_02900 [Cichorium intybus]